MYVNRCITPGKLFSWIKELNLISWNGAEPKYDIRDWSKDHEKMGKGITLTLRELKKLQLIIENIEEE